MYFTTSRAAEANDVISVVEIAVGGVFLKVFFEAKDVQDIIVIIDNKTNYEEEKKDSLIAVKEEDC